MGEPNAYPYLLIVRAYAPFREFGLGFHGDSRGPSTTADATSRIWAVIGVDPELGTAIVLEKASSGTRHVLFSSVEFARTDSSVSARKSGHNVLLKIHVFGANPMLRPLSPDIDVHLSLSMAVTAGALAITGSLTGDGFPNAEVFIVDQNDARRMLITYETQDGPNYGPMVRLWGDTQRQMNAICMAFAIGEDGNFR